MRLWKELIEDVKELKEGKGEFLKVSHFDKKLNVSTFNTVRY